MRTGTYFSAARRRWVATVCACAWLLYVAAIAFAPLPSLAQSDIPPWAGDVCSQSHAAPQAPAPDQPSCPHALCCLLGCAAHHGALAPPCTPALPAPAVAAPGPGFAQTDPARLPGIEPSLLASPRGPPATAA